MSALYLIREFDRTRDYPMVSAWWEGHDATLVPLPALPPCGIIIYRAVAGKPDEDCAALWLHLSASCGVCFLEPAVSKPGMALKHSAAAMLLGIDYLKLAACEMDYGLMLLRAKPSIARYAKKAGFVADGDMLMNLSVFTKRIQKESPCLQ